MLTNQNYGCGFPAEKLPATRAVYGVYCRAAGIFLSPVYSEQTEAANISETVEQTNSAAVFSQGRLKIRPLWRCEVAGKRAPMCQT